jgi:hypothetical protein
VHDMREIPRTIFYHNSRRFARALEKNLCDCFDTLCLCVTALSVTARICRKSYDIFDDFTLLFSKKLLTNRKKPAIILPVEKSTSILYWGIAKR